MNAFSTNRIASLLTLGVVACCMTLVGCANSRQAVRRGKLNIPAPTQSNLIRPHQMDSLSAVKLPNEIRYAAAPKNRKKVNSSEPLMRMVSHQREIQPADDDSENEDGTGKSAEGESRTLDRSPSDIVDDGQGDEKDPNAADEPAKLNGNPDARSSYSIDLGTSDGITIEELEALAMENNPSLRQLDAATREAAGYREQVSYNSNPTVGYQGVQLVDEGTDQHTLFIEKDFITGGKLELSRRVLDQAVCVRLKELETRRQRISTDVRLKFYQTLAAQEEIRLTSQFLEVMEKGLKDSESRLEAEEASKLEVLQIRVQKNKVELLRRQAMVAFESAWRQLAAVVGDTSLVPRPVGGTLEHPMETLDWNSLQYSLAMSSPEYLAALEHVELARTKISRQNVQAIPNVSMQLAAGFDNSTDAGMLNFQVAAPLMIHNRNHGNIVAAQAEYCQAVANVQRIEQSIHSRLAEVSKDYDAAIQAASLFESKILPAVNESLKLAELAFDAGEFSFMEVLVVRREVIEARMEYLHAKADLLQARTRVDGFLLTGSLDPVETLNVNDSLREQAFTQQ